ncbi:hypothetical protein CWC14_13260 [Pseudoalteromonas sp. S3260]|uniref:alpha/beta hydrolase n=1 Tax=Pseudoalteromonas sp. S3260 TaxID=579534 RepID=UPI00110BE294|nr:alpha/beta hydrolase-fold protein [Pseudoalteromonas sp. S3260]TMO95596.1 hypothetical protein CWC14_13260 [Pseudoalteromonas sp. S3260]
MRIKKTIILNVLLAVSVFGFVITGFSYYQNNVSDFVDVTLDSKVLNESRKVFIRLPDDFDKNKAYPLFIKTDGNFNLANWDKALKALNTESILNEAILVAIPNQFFTDTRNRDLVPPYARKDVNINPRPNNETSPELFGKADLFLAFIEQELLPYIAANYKLTSQRGLIGFSAGGSFTLYTLHSKPQLFNAYFVFSPAAWYDDMTVTKRFDTFLKTNVNSIKQPTFLYITVGGAEQSLMLAAYNNLVTSLAKHPNDWLKWGSTINSNAEHNQNPALSVDKALLNYMAFLSSQINTPSD